MHDTHAHAPLLPSHTHTPLTISIPNRRQGNKGNDQQQHLHVDYYLQQVKAGELNGNLMTLAEYIHALSAHTAQCSCTFTLPKYAHSTQVLANSVFDQCGLRQMLIHFHSYISNVLHASRLYGWVEYHMYLHQDWRFFMTRWYIHSYSPLNLIE